MEPFRAVKLSDVIVELLLCLESIFTELTKHIIVLHTTIAFDMDIQMAWTSEASITEMTLIVRTRLLDIVYSLEVVILKLNDF